MKLYKKYNREIMRKYPENNLRKIRNNLKMTLEDVADKVVPSTSADMISKLEIGERQLTHTWMRKLASVFHCAPKDLIDSDSNISSFKQEDRISQADMVVISLLEVLLGILIKKKYVQIKEIEGFMANAITLYRSHRLPNAERAMIELQKALTTEAPPTEQEVIHKLFELVPLGSA